MINVVIIEDENKIREGFMRIIDWNFHGFKIIGSAQNGLEGIQLIQEIKPDLVFVDINMPIMSGLEMLEKLKDQQTFHAIIISGYDDFSYAKNAIKLQVFDYLLKPVLRDELLSVLKRYKEMNYKDYSPEIKEKLDQVLIIPSVFEDLLVYESLKYMDKHIKNVISASDMADYLQVSVSKLNEMFEIETGYTFHKFSTRYRVRKAMELLITTNSLAYEIGSLVGFPDYKYFRRLFKKYTKMSMSDFRNLSSYPNDLG